LKYSVYSGAGKKGEIKTLGTEEVDFATFKAAADTTTGALLGQSMAALTTGALAFALL
jgi:hypothetical protein